MGNKYRGLHKNFSGGGGGHAFFFRGVDDHPSVIHLKPTPRGPVTRYCVVDFASRSGLSVKYAHVHIIYAALTRGRSVAREHVAGAMKIDGRLEGWLSVATTVTAVGGELL